MNNDSDFHKIVASPDLPQKSGVSDRLRRQMEFLIEIEKLKRVIRRSPHLQGPRRENDAEHAWHFAVMAMILAEHSNAPVDLCRVLGMALVHDLVEIVTGDVFLYDDAGADGKVQREREAAARIFGLCPADQASQLRDLWEEFEARQTPEARFAAAIDRVEPILLAYHSQGRPWRENEVAAAKVLERNGHIAEGSSVLWEYVKELIGKAHEARYFASPPVQQRPEEPT